MNQSQNAYQKLVTHEFTDLALKQGIEIAQILYTGSILKAETQYKRAPDEYEFYLLEVGYSLSQLLNMLEQLIQCGLFLSAFSPTERMKGAGITRASHIQYNIENFLIRTQSLYDRVLKLVNAIFHLGLDPRDCRHDTIVRNLHIAATHVPLNLKSLRKLLGKYQKERNIIVHHSAYVDDDLRKLEAFYLLQRDDINHDKTDDTVLPILTRELTRSMVEQKIEEFDQFLEAVFLQLGGLFGELEPKYEQIAASLSDKCGNSL